MRGRSWNYVVALGAVGVMVVGTTGCGPRRPARVPPPALDPAAVTEAVMSAADADGNGIVSGAELGKVPAFESAVNVLDVNGDAGVSAAELETWLQAVKGSRVAITSLAAAVTHKGKPLANATVRLVPESFMGGEMKAAEGHTDKSGYAAIAIPDSGYPGVNCGLYRVEITGKGSDGAPLGAEFNTASRLGVAVGGLLPENGLTTFTLE